MRTTAATLTLFLLAGCGESTANRCPGSPAPRCLSGTVCAMDPQLGCQVCRCATPQMVPAGQPPQGAPQPLPE